MIFLYVHYMSEQASYGEAKVVIVLHFSLLFMTALLHYQVKTGSCPSNGITIIGNL